MRAPVSAMWQRWHTFRTGTDRKAAYGARITHPEDHPMSPTPPPVPPSSTDPHVAQRRDLLEALAAHRGFLRQTVRDLTDEQAVVHPTVSALCLGGIVKHLATIERQWVQFVIEGPTAFGAFPPGPGGDAGVDR